MTRLVVLAALAAVGGDAVAGTKGTRRRLCLVRVVDKTGRASRRATRRAVARAIRRTAGLRLVSYRSFARKARRLRIPRRRRLRARSIKRIAAALRLDAVLTARFIRRSNRYTRRARAYRFELVAADPRDGEELARVALQLPRPRLRRAAVGQLISSLSWKLLLKLSIRDARRAPASAPATQPTTAPSSAPAAGDAWGDVDDGFAPIKVKTAAATLSVKIGGRIAVEHFSYWRDANEGTPGGRNAVDFALRARAGSEDFFALGVLLARHDFSDSSRDRFDAEEAYLEGRLGRFNVRAGKTIVSWGSTNLFNPTDIINPVDFRDPIASEKLGSWMLRASVVLGPVQIAGYFLPVFEPHLAPWPTAIDGAGVPSGSSRWLEPSYAVEAPFPLTYRLQEPTVPRVAPRNYQGALRVSAAFWGIDVALGYAYLYDRIPTLRIDVSTTGDPPTGGEVTVGREFRRIHALTLDAEAAVGKLRLAAEGIVVLTEYLEDEDPAIQRPHAIVVAGVDYRTGEFWGEQRLHFFAEMLFSAALQDELIDDPLRLPETVAALGRVRYEITKELRFDFNFVSAVRYYDLALNPELEAVLFDRVTCKLGALFLLGDKQEGYFGRYWRNSRVTASVELAF